MKGNRIAASRSNLSNKKTMDQLIRANCVFLQQADALLERLADEQFGQPMDRFYGSSIGGHLRHCLEHYRSFLAGLAVGRVDYDDRPRDEQLEQCASAAREAVQGLLAELDALHHEELPARLLVKMDCGGDEIEWQTSTTGRELQFLVSHTVHHFAMIGGICQAQGVEVDDQFGVAPSTLRHRAEAGIR